MGVNDSIFSGSGQQEVYWIDTNFRFCHVHLNFFAQKNNIYSHRFITMCFKEHHCTIH